MSASSETVLGLSFRTPPRPETAYALSKTMGEEMARHFCRCYPALKIFSLRFSNVMLTSDYAEFPGFAAQAVRKAPESPLKGAEVSGYGDEPPDHRTGSGVLPQCAVAPRGGPARRSEVIHRA